jgi:signal transduction histidine kinase
MTPPRPSRLRVRLGQRAPVALSALIGIAQLVACVVLAGRPGIAAVAGIDGDDAILRWPLALPVLAQAAVLAARRRAPLLTLGTVAGLDVLVLALSAGELGTGTLAVVFAVFAAARAQGRPQRYRVIGILAAVSTLAETIALQQSAEIPSAWTLPYALVRGGLVFGVPLVVAEIVTGRERLLEALRERADAAEREREREAADAVRRERELMARELHDVAGHHLSGIIVSAQAADALVRRDPDAASVYLRALTREAQGTLANLRQTVGLLRADESGERAPAASVGRIPELVAHAAGTGAPVDFSTAGDAVDLGPLASAAAYRMVQESLANATLHAPGARRAVRLEYGPSSLRLTVHNAPSPAARTRRAPSDRPGASPQARRRGFGLLGMAERADLIGAVLATGPAAGGGWSNTLTIPYGDPS